MFVHAVRFRFALPAITASLLLLLSGATPAAAAEGPHRILIRNFDFAPMRITVSAGSTVIWQNLDEEPHVVASESGEFRSGALEEGVSFRFRFDKPGTYRYVCSLHPKMVGEIVVRQRSGPSSWRVRPASRSRAGVESRSNEYRP